MEKFRPASSGPQRMYYVGQSAPLTFLTAIPRTAKAEYSYPSRPGGGGIIGEGNSDTRSSRASLRALV
ncbi:hypothetical protein PISMIDRAFT_686719 [Pisolithus microcarpus 441]|uniref:Uncharacterized protein n=1 Tax=Pisolithus microcarpus 441 TaxID=765257 RepID=A0A0C9XUK3_9AGAM|nr:hypothetical protein PISMIDRAFT_686719 [Pisolithus microcarpus 441]